MNTQELREASDNCRAQLQLCADEVKKLEGLFSIQNEWMSNIIAESEPRTQAQPAPGQRVQGVAEIPPVSFDARQETDYPASQQPPVGYHRDGYSVRIEKSQELLQDFERPRLKKSLYKTEVCKHYKSGRPCPKDTNCAFRHDDRPSVTSLFPCRDWVKHGCPEGDTCRFLHEGHPPTYSDNVW
ncbi:hypothetical protein DIPPA_56399 [Diplonema papillatum]|nr:hypothetical protein DIPPA_50068 [Diplonema papillatum]KAJ9446054.1 hypothetical protein DIPPA_56399 [Diplonema papillatum]